MLVGVSGWLSVVACTSHSPFSVPIKMPCWSGFIQRIEFTSGAFST